VLNELMFVHLWRTWLWFGFCHVLDMQLPISYYYLRFKIVKYCGNTTFTYMQVTYW